MTVVGFSDAYLCVIGLAWLAVVLSHLILVYLRPWRARRSWVCKCSKVMLAVRTLASLCVLAETVFALLHDTTDSFAMSRSTKRWYERHVVLNNIGFRDRKDFQFQTPAGRDAPRRQAVGRRPVGSTSRHSNKKAV